MNMKRVDIATLVGSAINAIRNTQIKIARNIQDSPEEALSVHYSGDSRKPLLAIDLIAEQGTKSELRRHLGLSPKELHLLGEESLSVHKTAKDLTNEERLVVLMDMVDGTDLLERGFGNWCSAMVFYRPLASHDKIIAAFVGIPDDGVYYATYEMDKPRKYCFHVAKDQERDVEISDGVSTVASLAEASITFYGQQVGNVVAPPEHVNFIRYLEFLKTKHSDEKKSFTTRIYNLSGMPMMMRMMQVGYKKVDVVFEAFGQAPHDMVAGAYIAQKAGACLADLNGKDIDLGVSLLHPADQEYHVRYILSGTKALNEEIRKAMSGAG